MDKVKVGIIGCGNISNAYFKGAGMFPVLDIKSCADIKHEAAVAKAEQHGVQAVSVDQMLADDEIELIINLTIPTAHAPVSKQILEAGKHVHLEKPFAVNVEEGNEVLEMAQKKGLRVGCAPDTFLGCGGQTSRKALDEGWIGKPLSGTAMFLAHGPEKWHPNPGFFYQKGGGPMLDLGPYYIAALLNLLGPVERVSAVTTKGFDYRTAGAEAIRGQKLPVEVPTHYAGVLEFKNGAVITVTVSFDVWAHSHRPIEIYGTQGSMKVPDPNGFGGDVDVYRVEPGSWQTMPWTHNYSENSRGIGAADMAWAIRNNRPHRCSGELALHALEIMTSFEKASSQGKAVTLTTTCERPAPLPMGLLEGFLD